MKFLWPIALVLASWAGAFGISVIVFEWRTDEASPAAECLVMRQLLIEEPLKLADAEEVLNYYNDNCR